MNIILLGPPGAGKGTQAEFIKEKFNMAHVSTGDILRQAVKEQTDLGKEAKSYMDKGELVPDKVVIGIIEERLQQEDTLSGFMLDGFPRTIVQAESLDSMLNELSSKGKGDRKIHHVVYLEVPEQELVNRLHGRAQAEGRSDDTEEVVKNRIKVYFDQTSPLIDFYDQMGLLRRINGLGAVADITEQIFSVIG